MVNNCALCWPVHVKRWLALAQMQPTLKSEGLYTFRQTRVSPQCHQITAPLLINGRLKALAPCRRDTGAAASSADIFVWSERSKTLVFKSSTVRQERLSLGEDGDQKDHLNQPSHTISTSSAPSCQELFVPHQVVMAT